MPLRFDIACTSSLLLSRRLAQLELEADKGPLATLLITGGTDGRAPPRSLHTSLSRQSPYRCNRSHPARQVAHQRPARVAVDVTAAGGGGSGGGGSFAVHVGITVGVAGGIVEAFSCAPAGIQTL